MLAETFPVQNTLKQLAVFFRNLALRIDIDPITNSIGISFKSLLTIVVIIYNPFLTVLSP